MCGLAKYRQAALGAKSDELVPSKFPVAEPAPKMRSGDGPKLGELYDVLGEAPIRAQPRAHVECIDPRSWLRQSSGGGAQ